jgi:hypothetical protein
MELKSIAPICRLVFAWLLLAELLQEYLFRNVRRLNVRRRSRNFNCSCEKLPVCRGGNYLQPTFQIQTSIRDAIMQDAPENREARTNALHDFVNSSSFFLFLSFVF